MKAAFLYGDLNELVYVEQPPGFNSDKSKVYKLNKALYGLKQASKQWSVRFTEFLTKLNLKQLNNDNCIFIQDSPLLILAIYVDDAIMLAEDNQSIEELLNKLKQEFDIHIVNSNTFLGFQYQRSKDGVITLHQSAYIKKILQQYNMEDSNPMPTTEATAEPQNDTPLDEGTPFREAVGSLMYVATTTRIDIAHATVRAARAHKPTQADWTKVKRIFRYLKGNPDFGISYNRSDQA